MGDMHTEQKRNLNPFLACDGYVAGPGFQYEVGRTRQGSGITSALNRPAAEIYPVDHRLDIE